MNTNMVISARFTAGSDIKESIIQAKNFAKKNKCYIEFDFNGVHFYISEFDDIEILEKYYYSELKDKDGNFIEKVSK